MKIGLYGIGLDTYWSQFDGLLDKLTGYQNRIAEGLASAGEGIEIVNTGIVDDPQRAREAGERLRTEGVELVFLYVSTYALSSTVLPVVQRTGVPVVILNLQPVARIDYDTFNAMGDRGKMTGEWLSYCQACSAPEISCVFKRAGIPYHLITGTLEDPEAWEEMRDWVRAAQLRSRLRDARIGSMGHYYCGMLDVYSDMTQLSSVFGSHFELVEMCALARQREETGPGEVEKMVQTFTEAFDVSPECEPAEVERAAHTAVALQKVVRDKQLDALAYYYEGEPGNDYENIVTSVIAGNTLLTMNGIPVAGEHELKNVLAMKIMDLLGCGGSFSEFYAMDFEDDVVLLGHDGPAHAAIAEGRVGLVPLPVYHGKPGKGLSIQMTVAHGPVTCLSVVQDGQGKVKLLCAEGESVPGPVLHIGNTNSRYRFDCGAKTFVNRWCEQGPAHHMAIGTGHQARVLRYLADLLGIECIQVAGNLSRNDEV